MSDSLTAPVPPVEPVLPLDDIQGIAVPGFLKPHQTLIGGRLRDHEAVLAFRTLLLGMSDEISTGRVTLHDRRAYREQNPAPQVAAEAASSVMHAGPKPGRRRGRKAKGAAKANTPSMIADGAPEAPVVLMAIGFTFDGLLKLTPGAAAIPSVAFRQGLAARAAMLGDAGPGDPTKWKVGGLTTPALDFLIVLASTDRGPIKQREKQLLKDLKTCGVEIVYREEGDVRTDHPGHEHFGFDDGISQPGIRGRASSDGDDFITPRHLAPDLFPQAHLFGYPGQDLVWPGELVLGHANTSPDPLVPGPADPVTPQWLHNGSYLVFRRLRQDVSLFWRTMEDAARRMKQREGFEHLTADRLASLIVGRWPSGAPVNRVPNEDDEALGRDKLANNHFRFDSDAAALPLKGGYKDVYPMSVADPAGAVCPWSAHIRKVNTRDSASDTGGRDSTYKRRLLRVGIPFGAPLKPRDAPPAKDPLKGNRGLLFLSIQASIEEQFEFLVTRWMGDPSRPKSPAGHDIFVGQNDAPGEDRMRSCVIFGKGFEQISLETNAQWIVPTGGAYLLVPSITAIRRVLSGG
jgi:Dyp-type peroxidase family